MSTVTRNYRVSFNNVGGKLHAVVVHRKTRQTRNVRRVQVYPNAASTRLECPSDMTQGDRAELISVLNGTPQPCGNDEYRMRRR